ncbi:dethiobiotin synthase [Alcanivorax sp. 1008]|uniref:dethiobiotin synthase n=1 Tax=Alcanivorax sp. 1008 TaxID=2816853 RepID=UPI001DAA153A|nr:dethiobiotin synthase [Alcanivorax sp. 1008]MCC1496699.1 dethiobiotin synthase [Alcanivorax sp. 1008]
MRGTFFVTGTDTEIGKTWVSCRLLERAQAQGLSCYGLKPIAAGCEDTADGPRNEDALALMASSSVKLNYDQVNPVALKAAIAPHIAAQDEQRTVTAERLAGYLRGTLMSHKADLVLVEGAGGWRVPLSYREALSSLPHIMQLPVILVVGMKLGCINHALLTAEAIQRDGLQLYGWVANDLGKPMERLEENVATLEALIPAPRITL